MKNIKVNYTNFENKRTSTTINWSLADKYYRESDIENFRITILDRAKHEQEVRRIIQKFVNEQHKEDDEETSTWEDQTMIEEAILEDIIHHAKIKTIEKMKKL